MEFDLIAYCVFFAAAFLGGFIDAIAGGGGLITLPAIMAMGVPPHVALATNKLQGSFGSFTAALNFSLKGMVDYKEIWIGIVFTFIGACIGTTLILVLDAKFLQVIIPFLLIAIFIYTLFAPKVGEEDRKARMNIRAFYTSFGLALGFYDGFFGPGAGSFWTFAIVALIGANMKRAVAHTKVLNFVSNIVSLGVFIIGGHVLWIVGVLMGIGQILGAYIGSNMVIKKEVKFIRTMFLIVVGATILKLVYSYFMG
ncbi:TSUP family transporter [Campylobacter sp. RM9344]|uniref:Probable membrane transporter protein n=1 Tax=Campylobacter californiensis TaxID=1032243 RepID=A0AAW3ZQY9_9BACT|nr:MULTISPECIES: TSUP family transporter [unclassified Campylobacter]MBE2983756.1 TSUP family transporter [Campylobacter sp. RM6883]MBE2994295.1 TSUP family transporter [Campylobacter sp. RM6913]MBE3028603.1 TSUP family transporter [Campylobacter sp. RM9344]MBE3607492.1 TSUP family transporter [Campylobacter sp. RM9337]QCD50886.1 putative membrane protein, TauE/SafE family permease [Campylobacter sp. RM6914]